MSMQVFYQDPWYPVVIFGRDGHGRLLLSGTSAMKI